jgi:hypothetical protein
MDFAGGKALILKKKLMINIVSPNQSGDYAHPPY